MRKHLLNFCLLVGTTLAMGLVADADAPKEGCAINRLKAKSLEFQSPWSHRQKITPAMRIAAARCKPVMKALAVPQPGGQPNYYGPEPNYANSPLPIVTLNKKGSIKSITGIRKFVDSLPGLGVDNKNNLGQYVPVAVADTTTYPGADYYEIGLVQHQTQLHSDLGATTLRSYVQLSSGANAVADAQYLGPLFIAQKNRPVRLKFSNLLPTGTAGNLFLPVDTSIMGAGMTPNGMEMYTQNRAVVHLHGGATPWISDGTPYQWITPAGETTSYIQGVSVQPVPDMPLPTLGDGITTYYYTNQQSARFMWYHDHALGTTRLNVYSGQAGGFLLTDDTEEDLINRNILPSGGGVYRYGIPLIVQDKTFVPPADQLVKEDPTWNYLTASGSLWFPHVYMPNQNTNIDCGCNDMGRWDYGPWVWPPFNTGAGLIHGPKLDPNGSGWLIPDTPNPSLVPEAFMDTPLVNGTAYPYLDVERKPYRFRILNACNDRYLNLQLYIADPLEVSIVDGGSGYCKPPKVVFSGGEKCKHFKRAQGIATIENGKVTGVEITDPGYGYLTAPKVILKGGGDDVKKRALAVASINSEVKMIPACPTEKVPPYYPTMDGRQGGVPDPAYSGPSMIQIGNEGGFLPYPVVLPNTPIGYQYNRRDITALNVLEKTLFLGPAERADVIIDFSILPKNVSTVILYNDAPAPVPGFDPRNDYYTNDPDQTLTGGAPTTLAGFGPNTRTVMQFRLHGKKQSHYDLATLQTALPEAYVTSQLPPIVPETTYPAPYKAEKDTYSRIQDTQLTFIPVGATEPVIQEMLPKALVESFELNYGRMNATLGTELKFTNDGTQTTVPLGYIDPPTEQIANNTVQMWKITHNGVDTHAIHTHLFTMQLVNRVGWDGMIKPPNANELGWKDTIRMNPLEDVIVAFKPVKPEVPFAVPNSTRHWAPTMPTTPPDNTWNSFDPLSGGQVTWSNLYPHTFGWEYVWHCHLLGHEENDMMRPVVFNLVAAAPVITNVTQPVPGVGTVIVSFTPPAGSTPELDHYEVVSTPLGMLGIGNSSPIIVTGLSVGTNTFTVQAVYTTGNGTSMPSDPFSFEVL